MTDHEWAQFILGISIVFVVALFAIADALGKIAKAIDRRTDVERRKW